ncbi:MAG: glycosyl transferase [Sulfurovum sp. AS07-7]|nr:MAG: glycosyl transferase [Sulfurovum sp. AS07-7]
MSNKKKLAIFIYSLASGGAERVVSILIEELKSYYNIILYLMNDNVFYKIPKDIKIVFLENSNPHENGLKKLLKLPFLAWKYKKLNDSDISLSFMNRPNYINVLVKLFGMKSKVLISERAMPSLQHKNGLQGWINRKLIKFLYRKADIVISNSFGNRNDLEKNFGIKNINVIHNPVLLSDVTNPINYDCFTFVTIGRLDKGKNHNLMIQAMANIESAKLYIIGGGELRDNLEFKIKNLELSDKVILLGRQSNPYKYLAKADCFIFSSNYEGFPNVLLEALACGLPIVSTDCQSGPREILAPDTDVNFQLKSDIEFAEYGILTPVGDVARMQEAMQMMIDDQNMRMKYKTKAKSRAKEFDKEKIIQQWIDIFEK